MSSRNLKNPNSIFQKKNFQHCTLYSLFPLPYVKLALTQYVAWKKPVIATDLAVVREHLGEEHFYFAPDDVESLTTTLRSLPLLPPRIEMATLGLFINITLYKGSPQE